MEEKIKSYLLDIAEFAPGSAADLEQFRLKYLSKKGILAELFAGMKDIAAEERKGFGALVNSVKIAAEDKIAQHKDQWDQAQAAAKQIDYTMPAEVQVLGSRHPISIVRNEILNIFSRVGFAVAEGPEIEDDWHNFGALNFAENHPARDMQDTFFVHLNPDILLRTHTSSVQVRIMNAERPPIRVCCPGRVYRNEAISSRAHCQFHQVEGLYIHENVSFADLKQTLLYFAKELFGKETSIRMRPSYFPFTEPSAEVDVSCTLCKGEGCSVCKYTGWLEIMGCGMVHPNVLNNCGIDSEKYSGYAFGMGIERIAMLKFGVKDIRLFFENDVRFLRQFSGIG